MDMPLRLTLSPIFSGDGRDLVLLAPAEPLRSRYQQQNRPLLLTSNERKAMRILIEVVDAW